MTGMFKLCFTLLSFFPFGRGVVGDLYLVLHVDEKHGIWREGLQLYSKINIDYTEAILGTVIKVIIAPSVIGGEVLLFFAIHLPSSINKLFDAINILPHVFLSMLILLYITFITT